MTSPIPRLRQNPHSAMPFWDRARDYHGSYLESINEDAPSSWETGFSGLIESVPVTAAPAQVFATARDPSYRYATSSFSGGFGTYPESPQASFQAQQVVPRFEPVFQPALPHHGEISGLQGLSSIAIQSCPASIHTSPVMRAQDRPNPQDMSSQSAWNANTQMPMTSYPAYASPPPDPYNSFQSQQPLPQFETAVRIAHPAAPNPFALSANTSMSPTPVPGAGQMDAYGHQDRLTAALATISDNSSISSLDSMSPLHSARPSVAWDRGDTIDPRWVSPAGSAWTTPAISPGSGSPVNTPYPLLQPANTPF
jgi:hypothetical protein